MCVAIWTSGLIVFLIRDAPQFQPFAMLGGFFWCTGNITVVPVVKRIGLGLGLCIWGSTNMLAGWASGTFGIMGVNKAKLSHPALNYVGVASALVATVFFGMVRPNTTKMDEEKSLVNYTEDADDTRFEEGDESPKRKLLVGIGLALAAGCFYGLNFDPPQTLMDNFVTHDLKSRHEYSPHALDYVFSHFCGIFLTSTTYLIIYCIVKKNSPNINPKIILPGLASGFMWSIGQISWFIANQNLQLAVSFPLVSVGPGLIGAIWGIVVFKEVSGTRNFMFLGGAFVFSAFTALMITLSKL
jgi:glucose uptake protein GlcU